MSTERHSKAFPARLRVYDQEVPPLSEYLAQCEREDLEDARTMVASARQAFDIAVADLKDAYANLERQESRRAASTLTAALPSPEQHSVRVPVPENAA